MRALGLSLALIVASIAAFAGCGSESDEGSSNDGGAGGAGGRGSGGNGLVAVVGSGVPKCVGCGEFVTTSAHEPELCDAASLDLFVAMEKCLCSNCEAICGAACRFPSAECSGCKLTASQTACKPQSDACASDL